MSLSLGVVSNLKERVFLLPRSTFLTDLINRLLIKGEQLLEVGSFTTQSLAGLLLLEQLKSQRLFDLVLFEWLTNVRIKIRGCDLLDRFGFFGLCPRGVDSSSTTSIPRI
jgi:hypothetical protein